tara:strand:- start:633 stop:1664 length:1032 start_codon:yes stop_codon:yes gene_type:complete
MKSFNIAEDVVSTEVVVTDGFGDGGLGTINGSDLTTASLSDTQKNYYYNLQLNSKDHFSVAYGHLGGSGSANQSTIQEGETQAIYKQFYNIVEPNRQNLKRSSTSGFIINEVTQSDAYFIVAERLQMKDRLNPGTWTLTLSGSDTAGAGTKLLLTDNSKITDASAAPFGQRYDIISGSAGTQVGSTKYGFFYPDAGLLILGGTQVSSSLPGTSGYIASGSGDLQSGVGLASDLRVTSAADNANKIAQTIKKGTFTLRSEENQYIFDYFCRAKVNEFNYSENMTFWSGSQYSIRHSDMQNNPQVYITEVGLYDNNGDLMAIGRLSGALEKNFSSEAIVKVRLTY